MKEDEFVNATVKPTGFISTVFMRCRALDPVLDCVRRLAALGLTVLGPGSALASVQIGHNCDDAADSDVPRSVLRSMDKIPDPLKNARYAASFLTKRHKDTNDSSKAASAYHSRSPELTKKHRGRFDNTCQKSDACSVAATLPKQATHNTADETNPDRFNGYPQLQQALYDALRGYLISFSQMRDDLAAQKTGCALIVLDAGHEGLHP